VLLDILQEIADHFGSLSADPSEKIQDTTTGIYTNEFGLKLRVGAP
jgi:hypothetical protein